MFTWLKYLSIYAVVLQQCHSVSKKLDNIISHYCWLYCTGGTILTCMYQRDHIVANLTKNNLMRPIEAFNICYFIGKMDDVSFILGAQHRPICAVQNRLLVVLFSLRYTRVSEPVQHGVTCHTCTGYSDYFTYDMYQFRF